MLALIYMLCNYNNLFPVVSGGGGARGGRAPSASAPRLTPVNYGANPSCGMSCGTVVASGVAPVAVARPMQAYSGVQLGGTIPAATPIAQMPIAYPAGYPGQQQALPVAYPTAQSSGYVVAQGYPSYPPSPPSVDDADADAVSESRGKAE